MRYIIEIDDDDRDMVTPETAWAAGILKGANVLAIGLGSTPPEAVRAALDDLETYAAARDDGALAFMAGERATDE